MIVDKLDDKALEDFNKFMSNIVIPGLVFLADKHNYDRDSFINYTSTIMSTMAEIATFENYKLPDEEGGDKDGK